MYKLNMIALYYYLGNRMEVNGGLKKHNMH